MSEADLRLEIVEARHWITLSEGYRRVDSGRRDGGARKLDESPNPQPPRPLATRNPNAQPSPTRTSASAAPPPVRHHPSVCVAPSAPTSLGPTALSTAEGVGEDNFSTIRGNLTENEPHLPMYTVANALFRKWQVQKIKRAVVLRRNRMFRAIGSLKWQP